MIHTIHRRWILYMCNFLVWKQLHLLFQVIQAIFLSLWGLLQLNFLGAKTVYFVNFHAYHDTYECSWFGHYATQISISHKLHEHSCKLCCMLRFSSFVFIIANTGGTNHYKFVFFATVTYCYLSLLPFSSWY